jgi:hypothetical protein
MNSRQGTSLLDGIARINWAPQWDAQGQGGGQALTPTSGFLNVQYCKAPVPMTRTVVNVRT